MACRCQQRSEAGGRPPVMDRTSSQENGTMELAMPEGQKTRAESAAYVGSGDAGSESAPSEGLRASAAPPGRAGLTVQLMEVVLEKQNLMCALERVEANKGSAGVDGMTTQELRGWLKGNWQGIRAQLLAGKYRPQPVRRVAIPKPDGGTRNLGIPTVLDRLIQQALLQVLAPIFDRHFSKSSYGFREGRSAHDAVRAAQRYVADGYDWVVDLDIEKFFDHVNHDILMRRVAERIRDKRVLKLIGRYLRAGVMAEGVVIATEEGTPQGGPLSPLLSNIMLDTLDKELEQRGHRFCRYADDCNIYVRSQRAGERVMESVKRFLGEKLKLRVNEKKSAVARPSERRFLSFTLSEQCRIRIAVRAVERFSEKVVELTRRACGRSMEEVLKRLNLFLWGWVGYFALADAKTQMHELDGWIRRRLRAMWWLQRKTRKKRREALVALGVGLSKARPAAGSGRGPWRMSRVETVHIALGLDYFRQQGLVSLADAWDYTRAQWRNRALA